MRFVFGGKQLKLHSWLQRGAAAPMSQSSPAAGELGNSLPPATAEQRQEQQEAPAAGTSASQPSSSGQPSSNVERKGTASQRQSTAAPAGWSARSSAAASGRQASATSGLPNRKQASLKSLFQRQQQQQPAGTPPAQQLQQQQAEAVPSQQQQSAEAQQQQQQQQVPARGKAEGGSLTPSQASGLYAAELLAADTTRQQSTAAAKDAWRSLQQRFQVPQCRHGEPAVLKRVNKSGPNKG